MGKYKYGKVTPWEELHFSSRFSLETRQRHYFNAILRKKPEINILDIVLAVKKKFGGCLLEENKLLEKKNVQI